MMRTRLALLCLGLVPLLSGCKLYYAVHEHFTRPRAFEAIAAPHDAFDEVAIVPVPAYDADTSIRWTNFLNRQLLHVDGLDRVRILDGVLPTASKQLTRALEGSDGLLQVTVLDFDPYYPPSAHVEVALFVPGGPMRKDDSIVELDRQGAATGAGARKQGPWLRFETTCDAADPTLQSELTHFARAHYDDDRGMDELDRVTRVSDRFMNFVFHRALAECFERWNRAEGPDA
ncbi:MAG: hypothetical protein AAF581_15990 [Planctomycetota bacterium]